jgi:hypothetical protein
MMPMISYDTQFYDDKARSDILVLRRMFPDKIFALAPYEIPTAPGFYKLKVAVLGKDDFATDPTEAIFSNRIDASNWARKIDGMLGRDRETAEAIVADVARRSAILKRDDDAFAVSRRNFAANTATRIEDIRCSARATYEDGAFNIPVLFAIRGASKAGTRLRWIEQVTWRIPSITNRPVCVASLGKEGYGHPAAPKTTFYFHDGEYFAPMLEHPMACYIRTKVRTDDRQHFARSLSWNDVATGDRGELHPMAMLQSNWVTPRSHQWWDYNDSFRNEVSFDGTYFNRDEDTSPLYASYEAALQAHGEISTELERPALVDRVQRMERSFLLTEDRLLVVVNEPKLVISLDTSNKNAPVVTKVSTSDLVRATVWFPMAMSDDALNFADELATHLGTRHSPRKLQFSQIGNSESFSFFQTNAMQLFDDLSQHRSPVKTVADDDVAEMVVRLVGDGTVDKMLNESLSKATNQDQRRTAEFAAAALKLFAERYGPEPRADETARP